MDIKLTPRLEKIAQQVPIGSKVADIGTDHGYIPIYLLQNKISNYVIAGDVNKKPLESAEENIKLYGYTDYIETRLGSGLEILSPGEIDTVIIAGMGGILIAELLQAVPEVTAKIKTFILQPMQAQDRLRKYLVSHGYQIEKDLLVKEDHRVYEIIVAKTGTQTVEDELYYEIGFHIHSNPPELAVEFLQGKIKEQRKIIESVKNQASETARDKHQESLEKLKKLQEVLKCLRQ